MVVCFRHVVGFLKACRARHAWPEKDMACHLNCLYKRFLVNQSSSCVSLPCVFLSWASLSWGTAGPSLPREERPTLAPGAAEAYGGRRWGENYLGRNHIGYCPIFCAASFSYSTGTSKHRPPSECPAPPTSPHRVVPKPIPVLSQQGLPALAGLAGE